MVEALSLVSQIEVRKKYFNQMNQVDRLFRAK